jgi:hypothetical protein
MRILNFYFVKELGKVKILKNFLSKNTFIWIGIFIIAGALLYFGGNKFFAGKSFFFAGINLLSQNNNNQNKNINEEIENIKINIPVTASNYEQTAQKGDGMTHLARRALKDYISRTGVGQDLTPEHKIYIEDYLVKKTGARNLLVGEKVSFSSELIQEAIQKAKELNSNQLENLKQYSALVSAW